MSDASSPSDDALIPDDATGLSDAELRRLAADVVELIETREGAATVVRTPLFGRLKHLTRRTSG